MISSSLRNILFLIHLPIWWKENIDSTFTTYWKKKKYIFHQKKVKHDIEKESNDHKIISFHSIPHWENIKIQIR